MSAEIVHRRPEVRVRLRAADECHHRDCGLPGSGVVFWLQGSILHHARVCAVHVLWAKRLGGCLVFPKDKVPHIDALAHAVSAEYQRRMMQQQATTMRVSFNNGAFTMYGQTWTMSF